MKIIQTPGVIVILNPDLTYRQIYLDGRALETAPNPSWMGYSVGHWEGDTLVVESIGFNDRTWLDTSGHPHTEALRMTERYQAPELRQPGCRGDVPGSLGVRAAVDGGGPGGTGGGYRTDRIRLQREGRETSITGWGRLPTKRNPKLRSRRGFWRNMPAHTWNSRRCGGSSHASSKSLFPTACSTAIWMAGAMERQYASSETSFSGFAGLGLEFVRDSQGVVTDLLIKHVSGDYRFARQK